MYYYLRPGIITISTNFSFYFYLLINSGFKNSLEFLKNLFKNGSPRQRKWALAELRHRWTDLDNEWQAKLAIFSNSPYPSNHAF